MSARGNALGSDEDVCSSPEGASQNADPQQFVTPFQG